MVELMRQLLFKAIEQDIINELLREDIRTFDQDDI